MAHSSATVAMPWEGPLLPPVAVPAELAAELRRELGIVPSWIGQVAAVPWLARALVRLVNVPLPSVPARLKELVPLIVSQDNSCRYCFGMQRALMRVLGYEEKYLERLERELDLSALSANDRAALDFARKISRANPRPSVEDRQALAAAGFPPLAIAEIAVMAASVIFSNRVATLLAFEPDPFERFVQRPLVRLIRPLLARRLRAARPVPRAPENLSGPAAAILGALQGSPATAVLRSSVDEAWASNLLPRRTKALIVAVIARALGCERSVLECTAMLLDEGFSNAEIQEVLSTLATARLDGREKQLVPFARDTVRYSLAVPVQRRMRLAAQGLTTPEVLEAVGVMALANAVCRLSVLLDVC